MADRIRVTASFACIQLALLLGLAPTSALAGIHTWDVSEVFTNADGSIQFVELKENGNGNNEGGVANGSIASNTKSFNWGPGNPAVTDTLNKYYLLATQSFANLPGAPTPDRIIPPGSIPFFAKNGDTVSFVVYDSCNFGAVPDDGIGSYDCITDTVQTTNSPTNYAGDTAPVDASAVAANQADDFQSGTVQNWSSPQSPPTNQSTGGPAGAGDRYLQLTDALNGSLGAFNNSQWSGNYLAAQIGQIRLNLNNFGPDPLNIRITLMTPGCEVGPGSCTAWTSTAAQALAPASGWVVATFSLAEASMTQTFGSQTHAASLANIERLLIRHDDGAPSPPGTPAANVNATLGIDNVIPEPSVLLGLFAGGGLLGALRRRRRDARR